jgi:hypothetical protein
LLGRVVAAVLAGKDVSHHGSAMEAWVTAMGPCGMIVSVALLVAATSILIPNPCCPL